jgi:hypothetical protein
MDAIEASVADAHVILGSSAYRPHYVGPLPYEHCTDGDARGVPFGIITPNCGAAWGPAFRLEPGNKLGQMFDLGTLLIDLLISTAIVVFVCRLVRRVRAKKGEAADAVSA